MNCININGIRGKRLELQSYLSELDPDVVAIQETKVDSSITNNEFIAPEVAYYIFSHDRNLNSGGTALLISKTLQAIPVSLLQNKSESLKFIIFHPGIEPHQLIMSLFSILEKLARQCSILASKFETAKTCTF